MATPSPPTGPAIFLLVLLIFASGHFQPSSQSELPSSSSSNYGSRSLLAASRRRADTSLRQEEADCGKMGSGTECRENPSCRWCLSNEVNDMCFSKSESLRLPQQIFSCES
ncbi:hypothetical protein MLD38_039942 [Melastoma candidum]|uniref:Uncharacterized protein n=1 Tax=Melastoma candidum TaxID=119954 RepID=A0ACB9L4L2_9MYRT|nr:hypothetical protein MLD38_039942 [Melastoma candidum]